MKILSIQLNEYKRFLLNDIKSFTMDLTEYIQLILGTNGSGKSSLMQELTPLPANASDFSSTGSKSISIEHLGALYDLKSTFFPKQTHSFSKNGLELNNGGTVTVQRDLVEQEFGITQEIHKIITSQLTFTQMRKNDRRYWFTKLSNTNYDYAISKYNKLKEKSRDVSGSLKLARNRLVTETAKIISPEERNSLKEQVDSLHELLQHLIEYRQPINKTLHILEGEAKALENTIAVLFKSLIKKKNAHPDRSVTIEDAIEKIKVNQSEIAVENILIDKYFEEHVSINETIDALKATGGAGVEQLSEKIAELKAIIVLTKAKSKLQVEIADPKNALSAFETVYDILTTVFVSLPENTARAFSKTKQLVISEAITSCNNKLAFLNGELNKLEVSQKSQEHQKTHDATECPQCNHKWSIGFNKEFYDKVMLSIETARAEIDENTSTLEELKQTRQSIDEYSDTYRQFANCVNNWPILKPLWDKILESDLISKSPRAVLPLLDSFKHDLNLYIKIEEFENEIAKTNELVGLSEKAGQADLNKLLLRLEILDNIIYNSTSRVTDLVSDSKILNVYKRDMEDILTISDDIQLLCANFTQCYDDSKESLRRGVLIEAIRSVHVVLSRKEALLSEVNVQSSIISDIQKQIESQELDDQAYKVILKELSPSEGLIAQGLLGFICDFTKQMNSIIKKVWLYPLEIIPCGLDEEGALELDYTFPLDIKNGSNVVPDVSLGSTAMHEIVNLAFKITAMMYMHLENTPLYLDEFSRSMDDEHKVAAAYAVKELMETRSFTQLFMVSHEKIQYGSLTSAEICVLCSNNIVIPKGAITNKHITMS